MIAFLLEWAKVDLFDQFWPGSSLLVGEGFHITNHVTDYYPVSVHNRGETIEGILFNFRF